MDRFHLSELYKGSLLVVCALDADNDLFNFVYAIVSSENVKRLGVVITKCCRMLRDLKPVIISDQGQVL